MEDMKNFAIMWQQEAYLNMENKIWLTLGLTNIRETALPEIPISDTNQDLREKHEIAEKILTEIYGY